MEHCKYLVGKVYWVCEVKTSVSLLITTVFIFENGRSLQHTMHLYSDVW